MQLLVVMPAFNEQESIRKVVAEWFPTLEVATPDFVILAINDGSKDATLQTLGTLQSELGDRLEILSRENRGHGQSCIQGYRIALERKIPFVLQIDSDGQSDPRYFQSFWDQRERYDVIYGKRSRQDGFRRVLASLVLRSALRCFAGVDCVDANVPYRMMNTASCAESILAVPPGINLANIALAVRLKRNSSLRHGAIPIGFPPRFGGEASVPFSKFAIKAIELFRQLKTME